MATVTATPCFGVDKPLSYYAVTKDIADFLPSRAIGECVAKAVRNSAMNEGTIDGSICSME